MKRHIYLFAAVMILILAVLFVTMKKRPAGPPVGRGVVTEQKSGSTRRVVEEDRARASKKGPNEAKWRHAKVTESPDDQPASEDSEVFLNFVQSDASSKKLRIGFRQEGGSVDPADLVVRVDLFDADGAQISDASEVTTKWDIKSKDFGDSPAPLLAVDCPSPLGSATVTVSYKGAQVEKHRYLVAGER